MKANQHFSVEGTLSLFSPKFYEIMIRIQKFVNEGIPTGKVLYYSDFRTSGSGSEVFEQILQANGYEKFDHEKETIDSLVDKQSKKKRYTFITGIEDQQLRKINKEAYKHPENTRGEYIQIMIISSAGAEGISLNCVRQVHIMEPFWNYIRIDQVFGRAIRMKSHLDLPEDERFVEQYLYLSYFPEGNTIDDVFSSMKQLQWPEVAEIEQTSDMKQILVSNHKSVYKLIQKILSVKKSTQDRTVDQILFDIMERKYKISEKITNLIKESSVDCIQNTRDDIQLNEKCVRFPNEIQAEEAYFPGISASELNQIDIRQFEANVSYFVDPDMYVLSARNPNPLFIYYRLDTKETNMDVRYIRENGVRIADYHPSEQRLSVYETSDHPLNKQLGSKFSLFQSGYDVPNYIVSNQIKENVFPKPEDITNEENLQERIIKYNVSEKLFYHQKLNHRCFPSMITD